MTAKKLAKLLMKTMVAYPPNSKEEFGQLKEFFNHNDYIKSDKSTKKELMFLSANAKYLSEIQYPWDHYFGKSLLPFLKGRKVLDLGCFNGGRGVAWVEQYQLEKMIGIDVDPVFLNAAREFSAIKKAHCEYMVAKGEGLPFKSNYFDAILTFDVFEHVQNLPETLYECWRVLRRGGLLCLVFLAFITQPNTIFLW